MPVNSAFEGGIHFLTCGFLFGENNSKGKGKGGGGEEERTCRQTFEAVIPPSCN